ncbi:hypothetical protein [Phenylobacterium montanum]|uniref:Uncharacterized protein n=1 Tax=Phenylobacterium montanum TaxID=2823693 RepID=A0A975G2S0_9CAUL|nr:hypothetical protein [Caulobacter sp. S6]QUD89427.1 hypothetical protein KCG34_05980 [Caulobacter sp. S6]
MAASHLTAVTSTPDTGAPAAEVVDLGREVETGAQRIRRLQQEARTLAREQLEAFERDLNALAERAIEIAQGGEVYPVGARELAARLAEELAKKAQTLESIMSRAAH